MQPAGTEAEAKRFLARVRRAADACGVTRLADITGLDRIGLPVWQAVRPLGRALSVHQGKGPSRLVARIGALCEAIESHCAEHAPADGPIGRFRELPPHLCAPEIGDYLADRGRLPADEPIRWCEAVDLASSGRRFLPHDLVSLDFTRGLPSAFDRGSDGLGAGPELGAALRTALLEAVERDAVGALRRAGPFARLAAAIAPSSVPFGWFGEWLERLHALGVRVQLSHARAVFDLPVLVCEIAGEAEYGSGSRGFSGSAAHPCPETALFKALAEALQSRLTWIAAVRDDMLPSEYRQPLSPPPAGSSSNFGRAWGGIEPSPADLSGLAGQLARAGYPDIHYKPIGSGLDGVAVAKVFVPGLGSGTRTRRVPA